MTIEPSDDRAYELAREALAEVRRIGALVGPAEAQEPQELAIAIRILQYFIEQTKAQNQEDMQEFDNFISRIAS